MDDMNGGDCAMMMRYRTGMYRVWFPEENLEDDSEEDTARLGGYRGAEGELY